MKKRVVYIGTVIFYLLLATVLATSASYALGKDKAPDGLTVWGRDLSGLSQEDALTQLLSLLPKAVLFQEQEFPLNLDESKAAIKDWLENQYIASSGNIIADGYAYLSGKNDDSSGEPGLSRAEIIPQLENLGKRLEKKPFSASMRYADDQLVREAGSDGYTLDLEATWEALTSAHDGTPVPVVLDETVIPPTLADLLPVNDLLGDVSTYFNVGDAERTHNLRLAAEALDGTLLAPGEEFSFNRVVGERTEAAGYQPALIFDDMQLAVSDGGGICQDSTTLYQAVRQAGLPVTERHTHSLSVPYVPLGQDATVYYNELDFRFSNDTQAYLLISVQIEENRLRIRLFGQADEKHFVSNGPIVYPLRSPSSLFDFK